MYDVAVMGVFLVFASIVLCIFGRSAIQWGAFVFGVLGAVILAMPNIDPAAGFFAFFASNIGWLAYSASNRIWSLLAQQTVFLACSVVGIWNWWLGPWLMG